MEENNNNPTVEEPVEVERTFTQSQLDAIVAREKAKATKGWFSAEEMTAKEASITALTTERDTAKSDLAKAQAELANMKQEKYLLGKGVSEDDLDYYTYKIGKLVTDGKTFEQAAEEFLKENPVNVVRMSTGGSLAGGTLPQTTNEKMNAFIRGKK